MFIIVNHRNDVRKRKSQRASEDMAEDGFLLGGKERVLHEELF
jgi:hypothetical protein